MHHISPVPKPAQLLAVYFTSETTTLQPPSTGHALLSVPLFQLSLPLSQRLNTPQSSSTQKKAPPSAIFFVVSGALNPRLKSSATICVLLVSSLAQSVPERPSLYTCNFTGLETASNNNNFKSLGVKAPTISRTSLQKHYLSMFINLSCHSSSISHLLRIPPINLLTPDAHHSGRRKDVKKRTFHARAFASIRCTFASI